MALVLLYVYKHWEIYAGKIDDNNLCQPNYYDYKIVTLNLHIVLLLLGTDRVNRVLTMLPVLLFISIELSFPT